MIPVSTLVSGIDNGPIHLGPLKLAWHFKGGGRGARAASYGAANVPKPWEGGVGEAMGRWVCGGGGGAERSFWHVTKQNMFWGAT